MVYSISRVCITQDTMSITLSVDLLLQLVPEFVERGPLPRLFLPAAPHELVNSRRAVVRCLHPIALLYSLSHLF